MEIIAEVGLNYEGRPALAYELIAQASRAGADVVKFQFGWRDGPGEINAIDAHFAAQLRRWCDRWEVEFMASIISEDGLALAKAADPERYKIASRTVMERPALVEEVLGLGRETFISLGWWEGEGFPFGDPDEQVRYLYCSSNYPSYAEDLVGMPQWFGPGGYYGYSDHVHGIEGCLLAASRGARVVETHFTLDKTMESVHGDHVMSADVEELGLLHRYGRSLSRMARAVERERRGRWEEEAPRRRLH